MINPIEILITNLTIYQQEDYILVRWWRWYLNHLFEVSIKRNQLVWTGHIRLVLGLGGLVGLLGIVFGWKIGWWWGLAGLGLLGIFPGLIVLGGAGLVLPGILVIERYRRNYVLKEISKLKNLQVVGITGSYGKTSVKDMLFEILDRSGYAMKTPVNFNTVGGIYRAVRAELQNNHNFLIAELGAYEPGDIAWLTRMVQADWGILVEVGPQHLERFGSIEVIAKTKGELVKQIRAKRVVVNWDNSYIRRQIEAEGEVGRVIKVAEKQEKVDYRITKTKLDESGLRFELVRGETRLPLESSLFGRVNVRNIALAASLAWEMGVERQIIAGGVRQLSITPHRLELKPTKAGRLIENTYSSNLAGFKQVMADLRPLEGQKALVTPGLVELGKETVAYHRHLGKLAAGVFAEVVLVGKTERTRAFWEGLKQAGYRGIVGLVETDLGALMEQVDRLSAVYPWVLWENDLPDRYY